MALFLAGNFLIKKHGRSFSDVVDLSRHFETYDYRRFDFNRKPINSI